MGEIWGRYGGDMGLDLREELELLLRLLELAREHLARVRVRVRDRVRVRARVRVSPRAPGQGQG